MRTLFLVACYSLLGLSPLAEAGQLKVQDRALAEVHGDLSGVVTDASGAMVAGATVTATNLATSVAISTTSDSAGRFSFHGLPAGNYKVAVERRGFADFIANSVSVGAFATANLSAVLRVAEDRYPPPKPYYPTPKPYYPPKPPVASALPAPAPPPAPLSPSPITPAPVIAAPAPPPAPVIAAPAPPPAPVIVKAPAPPAHGPAPVAAPAPHTAASDSSDPADEWFDHLKTGLLDYSVPPAMTLNRPSTVTVVVHGDRAPTAPASGDGAVVQPMKVSDSMSIQLTQPDNPGEFTIDPAVQQPIPVFHEQDTTLTWTVTPLHSGTQKKLRIQAYALFPQGANKEPMQLQSADPTVVVKVEGLSGWAHDAWDNFNSDPAKWIDYGLPGGGGFVIVSGLVGWWAKRKKSGGAKVPEANAGTG